MSRGLSTVIVSAGFYLVATAVLMFVNEQFLKLPMEYPWPFHWLLWGAMFVPPIAIIMFAASDTTVNPKRLHRAYIASMVIVLATMELCMLVDARLRTVSIVLIALCLGCYWLFRMNAR